MPRTKRVETNDDRKIPFKGWSGTNCNNNSEFYDSKNNISFCSGCRIMFFCCNEALEIKINYRNKFWLYHLLFQINLNLKVDYKRSRSEGHYRIHI